MLNRIAMLLIIVVICLCRADMYSDSDRPAQGFQHTRQSSDFSDSGARVTFNLGQSTQQANQQTQRGQNPQSGSDQEQSIRLKTELIDLRAVVTDKRGQPITDLRIEDFELTENGKRQEISFFSVVSIPGRGEARRAETPDANAPPNALTDARREVKAPARTVVLFVDTLHLSPSSLLQVKQSLRKFIDERLTDQDLTAIVTSAGSLGVVEQFTRDRRILRAAVARLGAQPIARNSLFTPYLAAQVDRGDREALQVAMAIYSAEEHIPIDPTLVPLVQARARQILTQATYLRRASLITMREVVQRLSDLPGQRLLVMVSDGFTLLDIGGSHDTTDLQSVTSRAVRSGVVIYSIDAKGLQPPPMFDASIGALPNDPRIFSYISAGEHDLEDGLNALAKDTGGEAFFNSNDTVGAMARALEDNQVYYTLAYYPAGEESEKKFRKIAIKIRNHPEYVVRAQRGYLPADLAKKTRENEAKTPQQRFMDAILAPLPATTIGVTATADFIEVPEDNAQIWLQIHLDGNTFTYHEENGRSRFESEIVTMIYNSDGKRVDLKSEVINGNLAPARLELAKKNGFQYRRRVKLKPGLYQIRVGVRESPGDSGGNQGDERVGTAAAWVEIPDLSKKNSLALSSLILSDTSSAGLEQPDPNSGGSAAPSKLIQGIRYYRTGERIIYLFRLYNVAANDRDDSDVVMQVEILKDEKVAVQTPWQSVASRQIGKDVKGMVIGGQLELGNFASGIYDLRVSVRSARMKRSVQRSIAFGIEP